MNISENNIKSLEYFSKLEKGWFDFKSGSGEPISIISIHNAKELLEKLPVFFEVFPLEYGFVQIEYEKDNIYIEMEIYDEQIKIYQAEYYNGNVDEKITYYDSTAIDEIVNHVNTFLDNKKSNNRTMKLH